MTSFWLSVIVIGCPFLFVGDEAGLDLAKQAESLVGDLLGGRVQVDEDIEVPIGDVGWDVAGTTEALTLVVVGSDARRIHAVDRWCAARQESGRGHLGACVDKSGRGHVPCVTTHDAGDDARHLNRIATLEQAVGYSTSKCSGAGQIGCVNVTVAIGSEADTQLGCRSLARLEHERLDVIVHVRIHEQTPARLATQLATLATDS